MSDTGPTHWRTRHTSMVRTARRAGKVKLTVKPKGKVSRRLRRTQRAKVRARVTYTPRGGVPRTKAKVVRLVRK